MVLDLKDLAKTVGEITEQKREQLPPLQGRFEVVLLEWEDITAHFVDGSNNKGTLTGKKPGMLTFLQVGIKIQDDEDRVVILHSLSLTPNRSEFFEIPKGVIISEQLVGTIEIKGSEVRLVKD